MYLYTQSFILKPSNCTKRTFTNLKTKLKFLVKDFDISLDDFKHVAANFLSKCDILHSTWEGLAKEFSTLMNGASAEGRALATRVIHPNLTSLKLIETVRIKIPAFPLTQFTICMGEYDIIQKMMVIANKYPYVMVASDCKELAKDMSATNIPYTAYLCRQLCEKYLQTKSLGQLSSKYNLGTYQAEIDTAIAQFTSDHPVTTGKLGSLFGQPSGDEEPLAGFTAYTPEGNKD